MTPQELADRQEVRRQADKWTYEDDYRMVKQREAAWREARDETSPSRCRK